MKRGSVSKKQQEEQQAIGAIYKQYIDTFQESSEIPKKTFVKSGTLQHGTETCEKSQLYSPQPIIKLKKPEVIKQPPVYPLKRVKKKSNLKSLGDELKLLQQERQSKEMKLILPKSDIVVSVAPSPDDYTNSTNLFVSNLNPQITETNLIEIFGTYGPLASVKIMWPRNEAARSANCGFVAFMSRVDAERALTELKNFKEMRINWGKSVKLPSHPIYIPPELYKMYSPPPPSGLPFNAQKGGFTTDLENTTVCVTIPFDRNLLMTIHRMIEFVIREGPEFEAMIMNLENSNPNFKFLTDFQNPNHIYYRWKLYSMLHGDPKNCWLMKPFRMYKNGSVWLPPTAPNYKDGMPKELIEQTERQSKKLTQPEVECFIKILRDLKSSRKSISEAMVFCIKRSQALEDIFDLIVESLNNVKTSPLKKIARLYLLSDIMFNSKKSLDKTSDLLEIFKQFNQIYNELEYSQDRECLKNRIFTILRSWLFHKFYQIKFVTKLENLFLFGNEIGEDDDEDEPLDGANFIKRLKKAERKGDFDIFNF